MARSVTRSCTMCGAPGIKPVLDFGRQPISSHFAAAADVAVCTHRLRLGVCRTCGLVQLVEPFPYSELVAPYDWIVYREPEQHLDRLVAAVLRQTDMPANPRVLGISFKDASTVERFARAAGASVHMLDAVRDLGATAAPLAGIETVQNFMTPDAARRMAAQHGRFDIVVARHVVEHAVNVGQFLEALGVLVVDGGCLVVEVPDCEGNLQRCDYAMVWEEHNAYFTRETLALAMPMAGCDNTFAAEFPYAFENCLVQVGRKVALRASAPAPHRSSAQTERVDAYAREFPKWTRFYRDALSRYPAAKVALYGAGHLAAGFVNLHGVADLVGAVIDDTPQKQGLFLPLCSLPIVSADAALERGLALCLFALSPDRETSIIDRNAGLRAENVHFHSIFADSTRSLRSVSV